MEKTCIDREFYPSALVIMVREECNTNLLSIRNHSTVSKTFCRVS